jgi:hypothetical protein
VEEIGVIKTKIIIEGGGVEGVLRDILGYGTIEFELKEIGKQKKIFIYFRKCFTANNFKIK